MEANTAALENLHNYTVLEGAGRKDPAPWGAQQGEANHRTLLWACRGAREICLSLQKHPCNESSPARVSSC